MMAISKGWGVFVAELGDQWEKIGNTAVGYFVVIVVHSYYVAIEEENYISIAVYGITNSIMILLILRRLLDNMDALRSSNQYYKYRLYSNIFTLLAASVILGFILSTVQIQYRQTMWLRELWKLIQLTFVSCLVYILRPSSLINLLAL